MMTIGLSPIEHVLNYVTIALHSVPISSFLLHCTIPSLLLVLGTIISFFPLRLTRDTVFPALTTMAVAIGAYLIHSVYDPTSTHVQLSPLTSMCLIGATLSLACALGSLYVKTLSLGLLGATLMTHGVAKIAWFLLVRIRSELSDIHRWHPTWSGLVESFQSSPNVRTWLHGPEGIFYGTMGITFVLILTCSWRTQWGHWYYLVETTFGSCVRVSEAEFYRESQVATVHELEKLRKTLRENPALLQRLQHRERVEAFAQDKRDFGI